MTSSLSPSAWVGAHLQKDPELRKRCPVTVWPYKNENYRMTWLADMSAPSLPTLPILLFQVVTSQPD